MHVGRRTGGRGVELLTPGQSDDKEWPVPLENAMFKLLLTLILIASAAVNCAAQSNAGAGDATARQQQEQVLSPVVKQIGELEDPLLRVFLRHEVANYLWESNSGTQDAGALTEDALADIETYGESMPAPLVKSYRRSFFTKLHHHSPVLAAKLAARYGSEKATPRGELETAYSMLNTQGGVEPAVEKVRTVVKNSKDPSHLIVFFLLLLEEKSPERVPLVLSEILAGEEARPGTLSVKTFFSLKHFYLGKQTTPELQNRYLAALVSSMRKRTQWKSTEEMTDAYGLMQGALSVIERQQPLLFNAASERAAALAAQLPPPVLERFLLNDRVERSPDPFNQLLNEIEVARDKGLEEELTTRAAEMAFDRGKVGMALDLVLKAQYEGDFKTLWRDQFIERIVTVAAASNDTELMNRAIDSIHSPLVRASALQKVALRQKEAKRLDEARETLRKAFNSIDKSAGGTDKAVALSEIALTYCQMDVDRVPEVARAFVSAVNSLPAEGRAAATSGDPKEAKPEDVPKLVHATKDLFWFAASSARDAGDVFDIARSIKRQDLKTTAVVGASIGLLSKNKPEQTAASASK